MAKVTQPGSGRADISSKQCGSRAQALSHYPMTCGLGRKDEEAWVPSTQKRERRAEATESTKVILGTEMLSADSRTPAHFGKIELFITNQPFSISLLLPPPLPYRHLPPLLHHPSPHPVTLPASFRMWYHKPWVAVSLIQ